MSHLRSRAGPGVGTPLQTDWTRVTRERLARPKQAARRLASPNAFGESIALFVSLKADDAFQLDSLEIRLNGEAVAYHLYSYKELEALRKGGVQRIFTGNLNSGQHEVQVTMLGKTRGGNDLSRSKKFLVDKSIGPKAVEINLTSPGLANEAIELKEL